MEGKEVKNKKNELREVDTLPLRNWAGNLTYSTDNIHYPETVAEVQELVARLPKVRVLGSRHSFNAIADSRYHLLSLRRMNSVVSLDKTADKVTVEGGAVYGEFAQSIHKQGYALQNLASLPHLSVAGACATATHGSGLRNGSLSSAVSAVEFVKANGEIETVRRKPGQTHFEGSVVHLGALGVVTKVTLDLVPSFTVRQYVYLDLPVTALESAFEEIMASGYSVSLFTDWRSAAINEVWIKRSEDEAAPTASVSPLSGAVTAKYHVHPIEGQGTENVTEQLGIPGPWFDRLPHFKMGFKPSAGDELQSEYFVPMEHAYAALLAVSAIREKLAPHLFISEVRTVAADDFWLSPFYQRASVAFHFTWRPHHAQVAALLPLVEAQLAPFNPRPHWAKLFATPPDRLQACYPRLGQFKELASAMDPEGKFRNEFLDRYIFS